VSGVGNGMGRGHILNSDGLAWEDLLLAQGIEDCYTSAELRGEFNRVDVARNTNYCFCAKSDVLGVATISGNTVDGFIFAHLGEPATTGLAGVWGSWYLV